MGALFMDFKTRSRNKVLLFKAWHIVKPDQISNWIEKNNPEKGSVYYVGFNAMNPCETHIMKTLITECNAEVFWDVDDYYLNDKKQEAINI